MAAEKATASAIMNSKVPETLNASDKKKYLQALATQAKEFEAHGQKLAQLEEQIMDEQIGPSSRNPARRSLFNGRKH